MITDDEKDQVGSTISIRISGTDKNLTGGPHFISVVSAGAKPDRSALTEVELKVYMLSAILTAIAHHVVAQGMFLIRLFVLNMFTRAPQAFESIARKEVPSRLGNRGGGDDDDDQKQP